MNSLLNMYNFKIEGSRSVHATNQRWDSNIYLGRCLNDMGLGICEEDLLCFAGINKTKLTKGIETHRLVSFGFNSWTVRTRKQIHPGISYIASCQKISFFLALILQEGHDACPRIFLKYLALTHLLITMPSTHLFSRGHIRIAISLIRGLLYHG